MRRWLGVPNAREESFGAPDVEITPLGCPNLAICPNDSSLESTARIPSIRYEQAFCRNYREFNTLSKFSFGPSQEDQGRKKTLHSMKGGF
jgi:hypothetical protein